MGRNKRPNGVGNGPANGSHGPALEHGDNSEDSKRAQMGQSALDRQEEKEQEEVIATMRDLGGAGAYLRIERRKPNEGEYALIVPRASLENYADAIKLEEYLMGTFGGGDFKIQGRTSGGKVVKQYSLKIDHSIPAKSPGEKKESGNANDAGSIVKEVIAQIVPLFRQQQPPAQDNTLLLAMMNNANTMAIESAKSQVQMMTALFNMMGQKQGADPALTQILNRMERAMESLADKASSAKQKSGAEEILALLEVIDRIRDTGDEKEKGGLLASIGEIVAPFAKQFVGGAPAQAASVLDLSATAGVAPPTSFPNGAQPKAIPAAAIVVDAEPQDMNILIRAVLAQVTKKALAAADAAAKLGSDPEKQNAAEEFAAELTRQIPEAYDQTIIGALTDAGWLVNFFGTDPRVQTHAAWLGVVRAEILAELQGEEQEAAAGT